MDSQSSHHDGYHLKLTWGKIGVILAAVTVLQGMGYFLGPNKDATQERLDSMDKRLDRIETCLLDHQCGR